MAKNELFEDLSIYRPPLTSREKNELVRCLIRDARLGIRYLYEIKAAAGLLHMSYDEIMTAIHFYRIDTTSILSALRIPWWSLCEYLIDPADDLDAAFNEYLDSIVNKKNAVRSPAA